MRASAVPRRGSTVASINAPGAASASKMPGSIGATRSSATATYVSSTTVVVVFVDRQPGERPLARRLRPLGQHGRLPVAGTGKEHDDGQPCGGVQPLDQGVPAHTSRADAGWAQLGFQELERQPDHRSAHFLVRLLTTAPCEYSEAGDLSARDGHRGHDPCALTVVAVDLESATECLDAVT